MGRARPGDRPRDAARSGKLTVRPPFGTPATPGDDDIRRELADHLELEAEDIARHNPGASAREAAAAARRRFGNATFVAEDMRAVWRPVWLDQLAQDLRHGVRSLRRSPAYTVTATITLALGIGASTAVFSLGYHTLARPFPRLPQDDLVWVVRALPAPLSNVRHCVARRLRGAQRAEQDPVGRRRGPALARRAERTLGRAERSGARVSRHA